MDASEQTPSNNCIFDFGAGGTHSPDKPNDENGRLTPVRFPKDAKCIGPSKPPGTEQTYRMDDSSDEAPSATSMDPLYAESNRGTPTPARRKIT